MAAPPTITINGIDPYDGRYEFDLQFTNGELHRIKQISGVRLGELIDSLKAVDMGLIVALAVVALERAGKYVDEDLLWAAESGGIALDLGGDDSPPVKAEPDEPDGSAKNDGSATSSGEPSSIASDPLESDQSPTGTPV